MERRRGTLTSLSQQLMPTADTLTDEDAGERVRQAVSSRRFAMRLRQIREGKGVTQEALAKKAGVSRAYLSRLEMGLHDPPLSTLRRLAKALQVDIAELVR